MATSVKTMDAAGFDFLKGEEAVIPGLYDDPSGYCTYGVGHLVHKKNSFLLAAADDDEAWSKFVRKMWPATKSETPYLAREIRSDQKFKDFVKKVADANVSHRNLVTAEADILGRDVDSLLKERITKYEAAVSRAIKVGLTQTEFNALVSLCFNIGPDAFGSSTAARLINENKYKSGSVEGRRKAIADIETAINAWKKSGGKVLNGLVKRRQREADAFLSEARAELLALEKKGQPVPLGQNFTPATQPFTFGAFSSFTGGNAMFCPSFPTFQQGSEKISR